MLTFFVADFCRARTQGKGVNVTFTCHADLATLVVLKLEYIGESVSRSVAVVNKLDVTHKY